MKRCCKELLLLWRDKFTGWWLLEVCDMPMTAMMFAEELAQQLQLDKRP